MGWHRNMKLYYSRQFIKSLGLYPPIMRVAYYWVDGNYIRWWSPYYYFPMVPGSKVDDVDGKMTGTVRRTSIYLPPGELCNRLNSRAREIYSGDHWRLPGNCTYLPWRCMVVRGGPYESWCRVGNKVLPPGAADVFQFPETVELRLYVEDDSKAHPSELFWPYGVHSISDRR